MAAETRDPKITCSAKKLNDGGKRRLIYNVIPLIDNRASVSVSVSVSVSSEQTKKDF